MAWCAGEGVTQQEEGCMLHSTIGLTPYVCIILHIAVRKKKGNKNFLATVNLGKKNEKYCAVKLNCIIMTS